MNILHVVNISFVIPYFLGDQLNWFRQKGHEEFVVCSESPELEKFSKQFGFQYKAVEVLRKISVLKDIQAVISIARYCREVKADIVTGHTPKGGLVAMLAAYITRVPIRIYFRHGLVYETSHGLKRTLLINIDRLTSRLATRIVCVSPSVAQRSLEDHLNPSSKQTLLANGTCNGIDVARFCRNHIEESRLQVLKDELHINHEDFIIGFTGRLVRDKGIVELVRAYRAFRQKYPNVKLLLVGMPELRDALPDDVMNAIQEDDHIIKTGYIEYSKIEYYYALMDIYVLASYREGFPTSVLEASSMELSVITTKVTGCVDSIIDNKTGLFVGHHSDELMHAIETLYLDKEKRRTLGVNGRHFVLENFRQEDIWQEIEKLYEDTNNGSSRVSGYKPGKSTL